MQDRVLNDPLTGEDVHIVDWNFRNLSASDFKQNFKSSVEVPLRQLLNEFHRNKNVEMPSGGLYVSSCPS